MGSSTLKVKRESIGTRGESFTGLREVNGRVGEAKILKREELEMNGTFALKDFLREGPPPVKPGPERVV